MKRSWCYSSLVAVACLGCQTPGRDIQATVAPSAVPNRARVAYQAARPVRQVESTPADTEHETEAIRRVSNQVSVLETAVPDPPGLDGAAQPVASVPTVRIGLGLNDAIETGLTQNPDLIALRQAEGVGSAVVGVAQTYPFNPFIQIQATPFQDNRNGGTGATYHYVLLMQTIQLAHQQQFREDGAGAALNTIRWNIHQAELLNLVQTERFYFAALYQRGLRDLARQSAEATQQQLTVLEKQLAAGQASAADTAISRLDYHSARQQALLAETNYQTALLDLRRQLNLPMKDDIQPNGDLLTLRWRSADALHSSLERPEGAMVGAMNLDETLSYLVSGRPDVMAARSDVDVARANKNLACANRTPDLQIGPYYQRTDAATTYFGFRAQMDLPVINNGNPLVNQREAEQHQRSMTWQQLQIRALREAEAAVSRYTRALELVEASRPTVANSLPEELRKLEDQFKAGEIDLPRVFQARLSLIQSRRIFLDTLNELAQAAAAVTAATGVSPSILIE
ncbi:MAG: cusC 1 [Planctomycetaceae bacterium]|nr:cusC 1 [Planctomycetaceae bacterium]